MADRTLARRLGCQTREVPLVPPVLLQMLEVLLLVLQMRFPLALRQRLVALPELRALHRKLVAPVVLQALLRIRQERQKRLQEPVVVQTVARVRSRKAQLRPLAAVSISLESANPNGFHRHLRPMLVERLVPVRVYPIRSRLVRQVVSRPRLFFL